MDYDHWQIGTNYLGKGFSAPNTHPYLGNAQMTQIFRINTELRHLKGPKKDPNFYLK